MHVQDLFTLLTVAEIFKLQRDVQESLELGMIPLVKEYSYIYVARLANGQWEAWDHGPGDTSFSAHRQKKK
jgi:hypothetical protein